MYIVRPNVFVDPSDFILVNEFQPNFIIRTIITLVCKDPSIKSVLPVAMQGIGCFNNGFF